MGSSPAPKEGILGQILHQKLSQKRVDQKRGFSLWHYKNQGNSRPKNHVWALYFLTLGASKIASLFSAKFIQKGPSSFRTRISTVLGSSRRPLGLPKGADKGPKGPREAPRSLSKNTLHFRWPKGPPEELRGAPREVGLLGGPWGALGGRVDFPGAPRGGPREATQNPWAA